MKQFIKIITVSVKRQFQNISFIVLIVLIPVLFYFLKDFTTNSESEKVFIGIMCEMSEDEKNSSDSDVHTVENVVSELLSYSDHFSFKRYYDVDLMQDEVIKGALDCAFVIPSDMEKRIEKSKTTETVTCIRRNSSMYASFTKEFVYSAILHEYAGNMTIQYIKDNDRYNDYEAEAESFIKEYYNNYLKSDDLLKLDIKTVTSKGTTKNAVTNFVFPAKGIISIIVFIGGLLGGVNYLSDKEKRIFTSMPFRMRFSIRFSDIFVPVFFLCLCSLITIIASDEEPDIPLISLCTAIYGVCVYLFSSAVTMWIKKSNYVISFIPFAVIVCLLFCPVFVKLSSHGKVFSIVENLLIPSHYINALSGSGKAFLLLICSTVLVLLINIISKLIVKPDHAA